MLVWHLGTIHVRLWLKLKTCEMLYRDRDTVKKGFPSPDGNSQASLPDCVIAETIRGTRSCRYSNPRTSSPSISVDQSVTVWRLRRHLTKVSITTSLC